MAATLSLAVATLRILPALDVSPLGKVSAELILCSECVAPAVEGKTRCQFHLDAAREAGRRFRSRQREENKLSPAVPEVCSEFPERVLTRLKQAEEKAVDPWHVRDYRVAWQIVYHCWKGDAVECSPVTLAYYEVLGCHEDQFYDNLMIRRGSLLGPVNIEKFPSIKKKTPCGYAQLAKKAAGTGSCAAPASPNDMAIPRTSRAG